MDLGLTYRPGLLASMPWGSPTLELATLPICFVFNVGTKDGSKILMLARQALKHLSPLPRPHDG